ncbi:ferredoxin-type protein NapG [Evansella caseinilytica]|uniref:Ferredoxin-type protein NapG n=1 Tax=Evansella caseinilytica TaxID=1503961 RepID=A0A1H3SHL5_9BACI|nr:4Fe-4S dicluster domain-containing protein [Evansella caseinilytica]SDZ37424.1 ferredoxin-type protein NapG [Evansella caseinilytica]
MDEKLNRRQFFSKSIRSAVGFVSEIVTPALEQERTFIRPPGAQDDELVFLTLCTRCGVCKEVCPVSTIALFTAVEGAKFIGTPYLDPNKTPCTFCNKCIEHCPTNALEHSADGKPEPIGTAEVVKANCLAYQGVMCDHCVRSCPVGKAALSLRGGKPSVSKQFCTGCGACVAGCIQDSNNKGMIVKSYRPPGG